MNERNEYWLLGVVGRHYVVDVCTGVPHIFLDGWWLWFQLNSKLFHLYNG